MQQAVSRFSLAVTLSGILACAPAFAGQTLKVEQSVRLAAPPAEVWKVVGDFSKLDAWHPAIAKDEITQGENDKIGAVRTLETKDGAKIVEKLLSYDAKRMTMSYRFVESPLPVSDYHSTLSVVRSGQGSRVVWQGSFKAKGVEDAKAREIFAGIYQAGLDSLGQSLGR